jgi:hypothetical protein
MRAFRHFSPLSWIGGTEVPPSLFRCCFAECLYAAAGQRYEGKEVIKNDRPDN